MPSRCRRPAREPPHDRRGSRRMTDGPLVELRGVGVSFEVARGERVTALAGVDLAIERGEVVVLIGPNGSGKSTLLRVIAGLLPADSGQALFGGSPIAGPDPRIG